MLFGRSMEALWKLYCVQGHMLLGGPIYFVVYLKNQEI